MSQIKQYLENKDVNFIVTKYLNCIDLNPNDIDKMVCGTTEFFKTYPLGGPRGFSTKWLGDGTTSQKIIDILKERL